MNLTPNAWISNVAEGWKINAGNELPACSRQDHDLVRSILCDSVKSINQLGMVPRGENERPAAGVKLGDQHAFGVSRQFQAAVGSEVVILKYLHDVPLVVAKRVLDALEILFVEGSLVGFSGCFG